MAKKGYLDEAYEVRSAEETRQMYDRWADVYDQELSGKDYAQPVRCARALKAALADSEALILDAGCGTGLSGLALKEVGYDRIDGCDFSTGMLAKAEKIGVYRRLFEADLNMPLDIADGSYDAVAAVGVFSFSHVTADAIDELARVMKPGAPLVIGINNHIYEEGSLATKIDQLVKDGAIEEFSREHGEHIPGIDLTGWVIVVTKR